jgi:hypothetical protein
MAIGGDPNAGIRELIDTAKAGGPTEVPSEVTQAMSLIPNCEKAHFFATLNVIRTVSMVKAFLPIPMPPLPNVPTSSNLAFAGTADNGTFRLDIAVPKQHLTEIVTAAQTMQQQMMQMQQAPQSLPPAVPQN